jgi:arginase
VASTTFLLYPEWQGSGRSPAVQQGALTISRELFRAIEFVTIESQDEEHLERDSGVVGLQSIAPRFRRAIERLRELAPDRVMTIGGTCGVEAAPVAYLNERYDGDLAVVWLDAHGDLNTPQTSPSGNFHGMVLRTLLGEGPDVYVKELRRALRPSQVFLAATRDLDPPEQAFVASAGISVTAPAAFSNPEDLADRIQRAGLTRAYLHLDLDALNPDEFPDTLMRTPGGPGLDAMHGMLQALARSLDVVGASLVEYVHGSAASLRKLEALAASAGMVPGRDGAGNVQPGGQGAM